MRVAAAAATAAAAVVAAASWDQVLRDCESSPGTGEWNLPQAKQKVTSSKTKAQPHFLHDAANAGEHNKIM